MIWLYFGPCYSFLGQEESLRVLEEIASIKRKEDSDRVSLTIDSDALNFWKKNLQTSDLKPYVEAIMFHEIDSIENFLDIRKFFKCKTNLEYLKDFNIKVYVKSSTRCPAFTAESLNLIESTDCHQIQNPSSYLTTNNLYKVTKKIVIARLDILLNKHLLLEILKRTDVELIISEFSLLD
jgi:hypothetical protein